MFAQQINRFSNFRMVSTNSVSHSAKSRFDWFLQTQIKISGTIMVGKKHSSSFQTVARKLKVPVIINKAINEGPWLLTRSFERQRTNQ
jgi:hypothetical protein